MPTFDAAALAAAGLTEAEIAELTARRKPQVSRQQQKTIDAYPRYVFGPDLWKRDVGAMVKVRNAFEETGGTIVRKLSDAAYLVKIDSDTEIIVHEADQAWV